MTKEEFLTTTVKLIETPCLYYVSGYKYQSRNDMIFQVFIYPAEDIVTDLIILRKDGWLWVGKYFAWDGCSGPTWDDATNMCAGLAHDALYALMRMGLISDSMWRPAADFQLRRIMLRDGALSIRAKYYEYAVNKFAEGCANPKNARRILIAPHDGKMPEFSPA